MVCFLYIFLIRPFNNGIIKLVILAILNSLHCGVEQHHKVVKYFVLLSLDKKITLFQIELGAIFSCATYLLHPELNSQLETGLVFHRANTISMDLNDPVTLLLKPEERPIIPLESETTVSAMSTQYIMFKKLSV